MKSVATEVSTEPRAKLNRWAIVSIVCAVIAAASFIGVGISTVAVFAVGAGHISLQQIKKTRESGSALAYSALAAAYLIATYALVSTIIYGIAGFQQIATVVP